MTSMPTLRNIANDTPADATDVEFNFNTIETHVSNELINRDGSVAMTGALLLAADPAAALGAATKQYVDAAIPTGVISPFAGSVAPTGWLLADGSVVSQATYPALFAVCSTTYNTGGEGAGNFRLPNLKTRAPIGRDSGTSPYTTLGATGGSKDAVVIGHSHTVGSHTHTTPSHQHNGSTGFVSSDHTHTYSGTTSTDGTHDHQTSTASTNGWFQFGGGTLGPKAVGDFTQGWNVSSPTRTDSQGAHTHTFSGTTSGISANHFHAFTTNNDGSGTSGAASPATDTQGVTGTNLNLQPYLIVNYIIKT